MEKVLNTIPSKALGKRRHRKETVAELLSHFQSKDRVLITIDPDPDSIGSALALKRLLWHKVQSTTIGLIRPMKRLNNLTMARLLKLPLVIMDKIISVPYDKYVLIDGQPSHNECFSAFSYTAVIDHHPFTEHLDAPFVDIRPQYGATSSILVEYLRTFKTKPSQTLATTLLYGIKTDTRNFERHTIIEDIEAFRYLFPLANHNVLRKIEISDLGFTDLKFFHKAVERKHVVKDRIFVHLDEVPTADILVVVRNDGYRKDAGRSVRRAFGALGCAGGHLAMARAEIPLARLGELIGKRTSTAIERFIRKRLSPFS
jgi:nanoRNase/pAp phosphatase (c-di-AMP/oligoRNAs hydrolase)